MSRDRSKIQIELDRQTHGLLGLVRAEMETADKRRDPFSPTVSYGEAVRRLVDDFLGEPPGMTAVSTFVNPPHAHLQPEGPGTGGP